MVRGCVVLLTACLMFIPALGSANAVASTLNGRWRGSGRIIVQWSNLRQLPFELVIRDDGRVTGRVGDATLDGRLTTRSAVMRWLGNGDYLISGSLQGPIIAREGVTRDGVTLMLSGRNSQLTGGMHTTGSKFGGKQRMVLSVVEITLNRSSE